MSQCSNCQHQEIAGAFFCSECGTQLIFAKDETSAGTIVYPKNPSPRPGSDKLTEPPAAPNPTSGALITLRMVESGDLIPLPPGKEVTIGRLTNNQPIIPDVDLSQYDAYQYGVSRLHASVKVSPDGVQIIDLGSANGTRVNGKKLPGHTPYPLGHGDVLILGKMKLQVLFRS